ncbi:hypothetical protein GCM10023185_34640 [Hymenobacter saemangeumensis]|uniref:Uncharacterized protein n=1 Tax=Hymenobacter saemangeumensis TaxID=1084522 RepID=A0ABP8IP25_9BACT
MLLAAAPLRAQRYLIDQATAQPWAGGPAHYTGVRYQLRLRSKQGLPAPDSLWLRGQGYALGPASVAALPPGGAAGGKGYAVVFNLISTRPPGPDLLAKTAPPRQPPRTFRGAALLGCRYRGAWHYTEVRAFTQLPTLSYP